MDKLTFINEQMNLLNIPYEFGEWSDEVKYPYYVGEIEEYPIESEDGAEESMLMITGWNRGDLMTLARDKEKIKRHFNPIYGLRGETESGAIAVFFENSFPVPSGEAGIKKIQINLKIKEWKGDI